jgi:hypothetical protein
MSTAAKANIEKRANITKSASYNILGITKDIDFDVASTHTISN